MRMVSKPPIRAKRKSGNKLKEFVKVILLTEALMFTAPIVHAQTVQPDEKAMVEQKQAPGDMEAKENKSGGYSISSKGLYDKNGNLIMSMDELNKEVRKKVNEPQVLIDAEQRRAEEMKAEVERGQQTNGIADDEYIRTLNFHKEKWEEKIKAIDEQIEVLATWIKQGHSPQMELILEKFEERGVLQGRVWHIEKLIEKRTSKIQKDGPPVWVPWSERFNKDSKPIFETTPVQRFFSRLEVMIGVILLIFSPGIYAFWKMMDGPDSKRGPKRKTKKEK